MSNEKAAEDMLWRGPRPHWWWPSSTYYYSLILTSILSQFNLFSIYFQSRINVSLAYYWAINLNETMKYHRSWLESLENISKKIAIFFKNPKFSISLQDSLLTEYRWSPEMLLNESRVKTSSLWSKFDLSAPGHDFQGARCPNIASAVWKCHVSTWSKFLYEGHFMIRWGRKTSAS